MNASRRVVVTGIGLVTPLGIGKEAAWENLRRGVTGIRRITVFNPEAYYGREAGEVAGLPPDEWYGDHFFHGQGCSGLTRGLKLLLPALEEALRESGISGSSVSCPLIVGNTLGGMQEGTAYLRSVKEGTAGRFHFSRLKNFLAHKEVAQAGRLFGLAGPAMVISNACSSAAHAIQIGRDLVRSGEFPMACVGGYEPLSEFTHAGFSSLQAITRTRCRPFDANRDGMTLGEGAGILVLERLDRAMERNVPILAEVSGYGDSVDTYHLTRTNPEGTGAIRSMRSALEEAGRDPRQISFVVAHATATPANDAAEATAIRAVFQEHASRIPVTALKPMLGHALGAAGGMETAVAILALRHGQVPPLLNHQEPDPACGDMLLARSPMEPERSDAVMVNACGFGGLNTTWIFSAWNRSR